ncbi:MAG: M15 family metallopeptidase [Gammaproteobacteria bacterium]|nr:M15 family metallopeptidase [Gammaproteobacteria bacterium]
MRWLVTVTLLFVNAASVSADDRLCSYSSYKWNAYQKSVVEYEEIRKSYSDLTADEIDEQTGCSVCREDQVSVSIGGTRHLQLCKQVAHSVEVAISNAIQAGQAIEEVKGYRVGKTKGALDADGNRTGFSNHSFGIAIDVNPQNNGLYENCLEFGAHCVLRKGGEWIRGHDLSLHAQSPIVTEMKRHGFKWGGEIPGRQKDFMHFSYSGY